EPNSQLRKQQPLLCQGKVLSLRNASQRSESERQVRKARAESWQLLTPNTSKTPRLNFINQGESVSFLKAVAEFEDIDADWKEEDQQMVDSPEVTQERLPGEARRGCRRLSHHGSLRNEKVCSKRGRTGGQRRRHDCHHPETFGRLQQLAARPLRLLALQMRRHPAAEPVRAVPGALTLDGLVIGMQGALKSALLTKMERRFGLDSTTSSLIVSANDMVFLPSVLLVSYFGSLGHRPRLLALSCFGYGLAALLFALPYFLFGAMPLAVDDPSMANLQLGYACPASFTNGSTPAAAEDSGLVADAVTQARTALAFFMLSGFIEGISSAPFWNLGVAFIDDVTGDFSGVFIGLIIAARLLSPTLAYQLYGKAERDAAAYRAAAARLAILHPGLVVRLRLRRHGRPGHQRPHGAVPKEAPLQRGEVPAAVAGGDDEADGAERPGLLCRLVRRVNRKRAAAAQARRAAGRLSAATGRQPVEKAAATFRGFFDAFKRLLSNPVYVCLLLGNMFEFMEINCMIAYMPKFLEMHFRIGSGEASMLTGIAGPGANVIGILISSAIASQVNWRVPQLARYHAVVNTFGILAALIGFFFPCPPVSFVGGLPENSTFVPDCLAGGAPLRQSPFASGCACNSSSFKPLCIDGLNFYSPCAANCYLSRGNVSCSCAVNGTAESAVTDSFPLSQMRQRADQLCPDSCSSTVYTFLAVFVLIKLVRLSARSQEAVLQMRCVRPKDKALGLGINSFAFSTGGIWVPTFVGYLFSKACLMEQVTESGSSCLFYDTDKFRYSFVGFSTAALVPANTFFFLAWYFTERDPKYTDMASRRGTIELSMAGRPGRRSSASANGDVPDS
uniref:Kazal-like domain-containing protein n=1 Tax=Macrostomum lignano TaxID=282301 RepID=A0A1I8IH80_9PLAT